MSEQKLHPPFGCEQCDKLFEAGTAHASAEAELAELVITSGDEVRHVLSELDNLAELWGDEGVFRRCRDRLRVVGGRLTVEHNGETT